MVKNKVSRFYGSLCTLLRDRWSSFVDDISELSWRVVRSLYNVQLVMWL